VRGGGGGVVGGCVWWGGGGDRGGGGGGWDSRGAGELCGSALHRCMSVGVYMGVWICVLDLFNSSTSRLSELNYSAHYQKNPEDSETKKTISTFFCKTQRWAHIHAHMHICTRAHTC